MAKRENSFRKAAKRYEKWLSGYCRLDRKGLVLKEEKIGESAFAFLRGTFFRWPHHFQAIEPGILRAPRGRHLAGRPGGARGEGGAIGRLPAEDRHRRSARRLPADRGARFRARDPHLRPSGRWVVRRRSPEARKIEIAEIEDVTDRQALLEAMGRELANMHRGTAGTAAQLRKSLVMLPKNWLHRAAAVGAERIIEDYEVFCGS